MSDSTPVPASVNDSVTALADDWQKRIVNVSEIPEPIDRAKAAIAMYVEQEKTMEVVQSKAEKIMEEAFHDLGITTLSTPFGQAYMTKPTFTTRYDTKAIGTLIKSDPALARILEPHRIISMRPGGLVIRSK